MDEDSLSIAWMQHYMVEAICIKHQIKKRCGVQAFKL